MLLCEGLKLAANEGLETVREGLRFIIDNADSLMDNPAEEMLVFYLEANAFFYNSEYSLDSSLEDVLADDSINVIDTDKIYEKEEYCKKFLDIDVPEGKELRDILDNHNLSIIWDYPLEEIDEIIENQNRVVMVKEIIKKKTQIRWFEVK